MSKQVIVMRKDLGMRKGKMIAQGAHASMKVLLDWGDWTDWDCYQIPNLQKPMVDWINGVFKKVCVYVKSEEELMDVYNKAKEADLPCSLIEDSGLTEFHGEATKTCCAIGPYEDEEIDKITGDLPLL